MTNLFAPTPGPRVFALPPGADFVGELVAGLDARLGSTRPEALADVEIFVNTRRAARALEARLADGRPRLLPRIRTVADLADDPLLAWLDVPPASDPLRRRLGFARLVRRLLARTGQAPESAAFALSESLLALVDDLRAHGLGTDALRGLDAGTHARHWQTSLRFLEIAAEAAAAEAPAGEARQRVAVAALAAAWTARPPAHPVIVAGSTGSRAPTRAFMALVAGLPQGALILPGFDADLPRAVWDRLGASDPGATDHPQHAFRVLADALGFDPHDVRPWTGAAPPNPARNALLALALRPAPVTDHWLAEAPAHRARVADAIASLTWVEAEGPRAEAETVALALREAAEAGTPAALVTADRTLARRVTAQLARWSIIPDDSAGRPLGLTPPGILLRLVASIPAGRLPSQTLLALLKHPLALSVPGARGPHLHRVQALEVGPLAGHPPVVHWASLRDWVAARRPEAAGWLDWLRATLDSPLPEGAAPLGVLVARHRAAAEALAGGPDDGSHGLWDKAAGEAARALMDDLARASDAADPMQPAEYCALLDSLFFGQDVPEEAALTHPGISIWGTLEARVQSARRVVLAGLNEGSWPRLPEPDPWLSRPLRRALGLDAPEARIGLAAHDFVQAAAAPEVFLVRATRDAEAPTVPSRWLLRLENLLDGMGEAGADALAAAKARGRRYLALAQALERSERVPAAPRPSPVLPPGAAPRRLSVTQVETLVRDPYAIYAAHVLRLRRLVPPGQEADALARGTALHAVLDAFIAATEDGLPEDALGLFRAIAEQVLSATPWPAVRAIWLARLMRIAPWFLAGEAARRDRARPFAREVRGALEVPALDFTLSARADRIDRTAAGAYAVYDYKSGSIPTEREAGAFHLQLPLEAAMLRRGAFPDVPPGPTEHLEMVGLGGRRVLALDPATAEATLERLGRLLSAYLDEGTGFTARLRPQRIAFGSDYDHLSRYGEWGDGDAPAAIHVG